MEPGEALRVTSWDGTYYLHRPTLHLSCLSAAGPRCDSLIELADPAAAEEYDREQGGPDVTESAIAGAFRLAQRAADEAG